MWRRELQVTLRAPIVYVVGGLFLVVQGIAFAGLVGALSDPRRPAPLGALLEGQLVGHAADVGAPARRADAARHARDRRRQAQRRLGAAADRAGRRGRRRGRQVARGGDRSTRCCGCRRSRTSSSSRCFAPTPAAGTSRASRAATPARSRSARRCSRGRSRRARRRRRRSRPARSGSRALIAHLPRRRAAGGVAGSRASIIRRSRARSRRSRCAAS